MAGECSGISTVLWGGSYLCGSDEKQEEREEGNEKSFCIRGQVDASFSLSLSLSLSLKDHFHHYS